MKKIVSWLLGSMLVCMGFTPAKAQFVEKATEAVTQRQSVTLPDILKGLQARLCQMADNSFLACRIALHEGPGLTTWADQVSEELGLFSSLTSSQAKQILSGEIALTELTEEEKSQLYLARFPSLVLEEHFIPSEQDLNAALAFYRKTLMSNGSNMLPREHWAKTMGAVTNLGLFGTREETKGILEAAKKFRGSSWQAATDVIAVRALLNLGGYAEIQALADFRLSDKDFCDTNPLLPSVWKQLKEAVEQAGGYLEIAPQNIDSTQSLSLSTDLQKSIGKHNPYNLFNQASDTKTTADLRKISQQIHQTIIRTTLTQQVQNKLSAVALAPKLPATATASPKVQAEQVPPMALRRPSQRLSVKQKRALAQEQETFLKTLIFNDVFASYTLPNGQSFSPFKQALLRAKEEGNVAILNALQYAQQTRPRPFNAEAPMHMYIVQTAELMFAGYSWHPNKIGQSSIWPEYHTPFFNKSVQNGIAQYEALQQLKLR